MANFLDKVQGALNYANAAVDSGRINVTVKDPTVEVSAKEAVKFAEPYIIALIAVGAIIVFLMMRR